MFSWKKILGVFLFLVIIGSTALVVGCGKDEPAGPAGPAPAVRVGVLLPTSGPYAFLGASFKEGIQFVLSEIDNAGGIQSLGGASVDVVWADDTSKADVSRTEMERLLTTENVSTVIGPFLDAAALGAGPLSDRYKIPTMSLFADSKEIRDLNLQYWRTLVSEEAPGSYGKVFVDYLKYLIDNYGVKHDRIAIINSDTIGSRFTRAGMIQRLTELGLDKNVVLDQLFDPAAPDLSPYALIAKAANPDVVLCMPGSKGAQLWFKAMYDQNFYPNIWIGGGEITQEGFRKAVTPALHDAVIQKTSVFGTTTYSPNINIQSAKDNTAKIKAWCDKNGTVLGEAQLQGAQAMYAVWSALEKAGSADPVKINDAFHTLSITQDDPHFLVPVYAPALEWTSFGGIKNAIPLMGQIQNGEQVIIWPVAVQQATPTFH